MKASWNAWIQGGKAVAQAGLAGIAYLGVVAILMYPAFDASRSLG